MLQKRDRLFLLALYEQDPCKELQKNNLNLVTSWWAKNWLYIETKKVKKFHSFIWNLKHKLLSSESTVKQT